MLFNQGQRCSQLLQVGTGLIHTGTSTIPLTGAYLGICSESLTVFSQCWRFPLAGWRICICVSSTLCNFCICKAIIIRNCYFSVYVYRQLEVSFLPLHLSSFSLVASLQAGENISHSEVGQGRWVSLDWQKAARKLATYE